MSKFKKTFGTVSGAKGKWDTVSFSNQGLQPHNRYVAWVDLMGAANAMQMSLPGAANFIARIHAAALQAMVVYESVSLHPITDGFFVVEEKWEVMRAFLRKVYLSPMCLRRKERIYIGF